MWTYARFFHLHVSQVSAAKESFGDVAAVWVSNNIPLSLLAIFPFTWQTIHLYSYIPLFHKTKMTNCMSETLIVPHSIAHQTFFVYISFYVSVRWLGFMKNVALRDSFYCSECQENSTENNSVIIKLSFICSFLCLNFWPDGIVRLLPEETCQQVPSVLQANHWKGTLIITMGFALMLICSDLYMIPIPTPLILMEPLMYGAWSKFTKNFFQKLRKWPLSQVNNA